MININAEPRLNNKIPFIVTNSERGDSRCRLSKIKKVLLVQPREATPDGSFALPTRYPSTLFALAGALVKRFSNIEIHIADLALPDMDLKKILKDVEPDLVGVTFMTPQYYMAADIVRTIRELRGRDSIIVGGGVHTTALPFETMERIDFDYLVVGEGEEVFPNLISALDSSETPYFERIPSILWRADSTIMNNPRGPRVYNLDDYPIPSMLVPSGFFDFYAPIKMVTIEGVLGTLFSSRGCHYQCANCGDPIMYPRQRRGDPKIAARSPESVLREVKYLHDIHGIRGFRFQDDSFLFDKARAMEIAGLFSVTGLGEVEFSCLANAFPATEDNQTLLAKLKNGGFAGISIGVESGDEKLLGKLSMKKTGVKYAEAMANMMREIGIGIHTFWMFGLPGQDEASIDKSIALLQRIKPDAVGLAVAMPYPGTRLGEFGLKIIDWDKSRPQYNVMVHQFPITARGEGTLAFNPPTYTNEMTSVQIFESMRKFATAFQELRK